MITNDKQYKSARLQIVRFEEALTALDSAPATLPQALVQAQRDALVSQIEELREDADLYDRLRAGQVTEFAAENLAELPDILIQARIARGLSQRELADYLGLKEQQVQRYEAERYRSASLDRLIEVSDALGVQVAKRAELVGDATLRSVDPNTWQAFPLAEMYKRGWFEDFEGSLADARKAASEIIPAFLRGGQARNAAPALHRKSVRASGQVHEAAITAWEARVRRLAERDAPTSPFSPDRIDDAWLADLLALTLQSDGPARAIEHLRKIGIALVAEKHLPSTLLDGAALATLEDYTIVAMTLRHDRLDNFWFTLFHEIGHLKFHIGQGFASIFDDTDAPAGSDIETQADLFAQEMLLPSAKWALGISRFTRNEQAVRTDAKRFGVGAAIIAGRVRREAHDYTLLRNLVGNGEVRRQFGWQRRD
ncbi:helix-turn-helix domain-containing protein [Sphingomonas sp. Leaf4]|uniref:helix-turn-helix domain-containing protein n=1 Tax=Sphingomonas sp. Leaf4 TaxID=2876553 RepID=UPI001E31454E|nr:XRE family transcriptional regulator [Sphingomonas sp. Leaf4]